MSWKSIIPNAHENECILCGSRRDLQKHHCIPGRGRRLSAEADGLYVKLCMECHVRVHEHDSETLLELKKQAERAYLYDHTMKEWFERYGKNYL